MRRLLCIKELTGDRHWEAGRRMEGDKTTVRKQESELDRKQTLVGES